MNLRDKYKSKQLILGPCSGESYDQLDQVFSFYSQNEVPLRYLRVGVWKPRSRPGSFEGKAEGCLTWIEELQKQYAIPAITEVADTAQLEQVLKHEMKAIWIGARTAADPFSVQRIADALQGSEIDVYIKNSIHPDLPLWIGNVERVAKSIKGNVAGIHRGFSVYDRKEKYRNRPNWSIALEFKRLLPEVPLIGDPSHIAGKREFVFGLGQKMWDMNYDGLMVEVHPEPNAALSDAAQQISLEDSLQYLEDWRIYEGRVASVSEKDRLEYLRQNIDAIDAEIVELLADRQKISEEIGKLKKDINLPAYIPERWNQILANSTTRAQMSDLSPDIIKRIYDEIHQLSIKAQMKHLTEKKNKNDEMSQ